MHEKKKNNLLSFLFDTILNKTFITNIQLELETNNHFTRKNFLTTSLVEDNFKPDIEIM